jgi:curved DNA-binding protein CbpA
MIYFERLGIDESVDDINTIKTTFEEKIIQLDMDESVSYENKDIEYAKLKKAYSIISNERTREQYKQIIANTDLYIVLDVTMNDDMKILRKHYNQLIKLHHPDKYGDENACKNIQHAFDVLTNEEKRKKYNKLQIAQFDDLKKEYNNEPTEEEKQKKAEIDNLSNAERRGLFEKLNENFNEHELIIGRNDDDEGNLTREDILQYEKFEHMSVAEQLARRMAERDEMDEHAYEIERPINEKDFEQKFSQAVVDGNAFTIDELDNEHYGIMEQNELQEFEQNMEKRLGTDNEHIKELMKSYKRERKTEEKQMKHELEQRKETQVKQLSDMLDDLLKEDEDANIETDTGYTAITFDDVNHYEL